MPARIVRGYVRTYSTPVYLDAGVVGVTACTVSQSAARRESRASRGVRRQSAPRPTCDSRRPSSQSAVARPLESAAGPAHVISSATTTGIPFDATGSRSPDHGEQLPPLEEPRQRDEADACGIISAAGLRLPFEVQRQLLP